MTSNERERRLAESLALGIDRRRFITRSVGTLALSAPLVSFLAACGGDDNDTSSSGGGSSDYGTRAHPLVFHHDAAVGPLFEPYVRRFNRDYAPLVLRTSYVAQDYFAVTSQQLAGGNADYDVLFADEGYLELWRRNQWIRDLGDFPTDDLLANLNPGVEADLRAASGELVALPYFRGAEIFVYNREHLDRINARPPATWDEFVEMARELKGRGISDTPYSPYWISYAFLIWHQLAAEAASDGAEPFFGESFEANFTSDPAVERTLQRWISLLKEGLVPADVFTTDYGGVTNIFAGGKSTFSLRYQAQVAGWRNPDQSRVADVVSNALIPGSTHTTHSFGAYWFMSETTGGPEQAWELMSYLGGPGRNDDYVVPKELVAKTLGLSSGYRSVDTDPEVLEAWGRWADIRVLQEQLDNVVSLGPVVNQAWYPRFLDRISVILQDIVRGRTSIRDGLSQAREFVDGERA